MNPQLTIIKIGGKVLDNPDQLSELLDIFIKIPGYKILTHGGGKTASAMAGRLDIETQMVNGRRITNPEMLKVAVMIYGGLISRQIVAQLQARGQNALSLTGADLDIIQSVKRPVEEIDYGLVGDVAAVNADVLDMLIRQDIVPVIAPLTHDGQGQLLNTNADTIASAVAGSLADAFQVNLVYCFEKPGVLLDPANDSSVISHLTSHDYQSFLGKGIIAAGMIPKLTNAFDALKAGVDKVYICQAEAILNIGKNEFVGTLVLPDA